MQVLQKHRQVLLAVAERNDDRDPISRATVRRLEASAGRDLVGESLLNVFEEFRLSIDFDGALQVRRRRGTLIEPEHLHDAAEEALVLDEAGIEVLVLGLLHRLLVLHLVV